MLIYSAAPYSDDSLRTGQSDGISMDLFGAFGDYLNPLRCTLNAFEINILENYLLCCPFWYAYDTMMAFLEQQCGAGEVDAIDTYREMIIPMMRERCPANRNGAIGCSAIQHFFLLFLGFSMILMILIVLWTVVITVTWYRMRKQVQTQPYKSVQKNKSYLHKPMQLELRPLTNGKSADA